MAVENIAACSSRVNGGGCDSLHVSRHNLVIDDPIADLAGPWRENRWNSA
jgi:hypothetical protein